MLHAGGFRDGNNLLRPDVHKIAAKIGTSRVISQLSHRPRSIVFLGTAHDNGGTSILASNLAAAMRTHGHHVEEWYLFGSDGDLPAGARVFVRDKALAFAARC